MQSLMFVQLNVISDFNQNNKLKTNKMKTLKETKKITLATLKSFAKRNENNLYVMEKSRFSGMSDMVEQTENPEFIKTEITDNTRYYATGIQGVYTVGSSRDYFNYFENKNYIGIKVYNCCGSCVLAAKKQPEKV